MNNLKYRRSAGFTLIELAMVLMVVALLLGGMLVPFATQVELSQYRDVEGSMQDIEEALLGFAMAQGRLPCPDLDGDGVEDQAIYIAPQNDPATDGCLGGVYEGFLPWVTLGIDRGDAWGNRYRYRVTNEFTRRFGDVTAAVPPCNVAGWDNSCTLELGNVGNLLVTTRNTGTKAPENLITNSPAVVVSHGKNAYGSTSTDGTANALPPAVNDDEEENRDNDNSFIKRNRARESAVCSDAAAPPADFCEFDDVVLWLSPNVLVNRMVTAGRLP